MDEISSAKIQSFFKSNNWFKLHEQMSQNWAVKYAVIERKA